MAKAEKFVFKIRKIILTLEIAKQMNKEKFIFFLSIRFFDFFYF